MLNPDLTTGLVGGGGVANLYMTVNEALVVQDDRYDWVPQLASEQISVERGTWRINADGTMRTIWRLRPDVRWHDGAPFTSEDLVFSFNVYRDPAVPNRGRQALELTLSASATDPATFVIDWASPYAYADRAEGLIPLPKHLLGEIYGADPSALLDSRALTSQFVGLGPYRLLAWAPGSHLELGRFDDYYRGRPPFDSVMVRVIADQSAMIAALLAGTIDVIPGNVLGVEAALGLRDQWAAAGNRVEFATTPSFRQLDVQHDRELARPLNGVTNRQVRQALYHAIDRAAIVDAFAGGLAPTADGLIPPTHALRRQVESSIPQFPYDPSQARRLLAEAGWVPGTDGVLTQQRTGERFELDLRVNPGAEGQQVHSIVGQDWRAVGVAVQLTVLSPALASDREHRAKMPGAIVFNHPADRYYVRGDLHSRNIPSAEDRWAGGNRAHYRSATVDALIDQLAVRITPEERIQLLRDLSREVMEDVALMPLHWVVEPIAARGGIKGIRGSLTWNVFEWNEE